jgi:hypothetical protein
MYDRLYVPVLCDMYRSYLSYELILPGTQTIRKNKIIAILGNKLHQYTVLFVLAFTVYSGMHMWRAYAFRGNTFA